MPRFFPLRKKLPSSQVSSLKMAAMPRKTVRASSGLIWKWRVLPTLCTFILSLWPTSVWSVRMNCGLHLEKTRFTTAPTAAAWSGGRAAERPLQSTDRAVPCTTTSCPATSWAARPGGVASGGEGQPMSSQSASLTAASSPPSGLPGQVGLGAGLWEEGGVQHHVDDESPHQGPLWECALSHAPSHASNFAPSAPAAQWGSPSWQGLPQQEGDPGASSPASNFVSSSEPCPTQGSPPSMQVPQQEGELTHGSILTPSERSPH
mmetsp:Transcript_16648/g.42158  ORF Transcript_16648/g.42158 Transcript_16648/m.42158 type:complete len:262 (+) Transcript_16648:393-1178(+)